MWVLLRKLIKVLLLVISKLEAAKPADSVEEVQVVVHVRTGDEFGYRLQSMVI